MSPSTDANSINVSRNISPKDAMLAGEARDAYFSVGLGALELCNRILQGRIPKRVIDFPSGYGRAMRWFRADWPSAEIFGVETDPAALAFVESEFGAIPVAADPSLNMSIPLDADLIFSGSLLTHFDKWQWDLFFALCVNALAPDGTLIFTTHGRIAALLAKKRDPVYGDLIDTEALYYEYEAAGFAFRPYSSDYPTFGLSLSTPEWVMGRLQRLPSVKIIAFEEGGWGQDVYALRQNPWPMLPT
jgi:SAM-dependent methyltransferase